MATVITDLAAAFSKGDALAMFVFTLILAAAMLVRRRRPLTPSRALDVGSSALLFGMLGVRYAIDAAAVLIAPLRVLPGAGETTSLAFVGLYALASAIGFATYRGSVALRGIGALTLAAATVAEAVANRTVLEASTVTRLDTVFSIAIGVGACVLAAYFWTHRTAIPSPLGNDKRPFDY